MPEYAGEVVDRMQVLGPVTAKRMFGGHGIFIDGLMFALISDNTLYLKVDEITRRGFESEGLEAFAYTRQGKVLHLAYMQAPAEILEDLDVMRSWGNDAIEVALRANAGKTKRRPG